MNNRSFVSMSPAAAFLIAIFLMLQFMSSGCVQAGKTETGSEKLKIAPDFALLDINGKEQRLSDFKGKVVILDFWATWCPPCRQEIPHFTELYKAYKLEGLEVIGVALDMDHGQAVARFAEDYNINYTVLLGDRKVSDLYGGIRMIPTTFVLDRDGSIVKKYVGYRGKDVFEMDIKELL